MKNALQTLSQANLTPASLKLLGAVPFVALVAFVVLKLAEVVPS
jgi:hypothetical protein